MTLLHASAAAIEFVALLLIPVILLSRKEPVATYAWLLTLLFLPGLGALLFVLIGRSSLRRLPGQPMAAPRAASLPATEPGAPLEPGVVRDVFQVAAVLSDQPARTGNAIEVLLEGDVAYAAIGSAIDQAQREVIAVYYLVHDDAIGAWFAERLAAAVARGVTVRLLLDGYGSLALGWRWQRRLARQGVHIARFAPLGRFLATSPNLRNHRKIVVVDDAVAFTGGMNISAWHSARIRGPQAWRDVHLRLQGPAVAALHAVAARDWRRATGESLVAAAPPAPVGTARVAVLASGPDDVRDGIHRVLLTAIAAARSQVRIIAPYFFPDEAILVALELASLRGVVVELLLPSRSNHRVTFHAGRSCYDRLLAAGVRVSEYLPGMIHAKVTLIDGVLALVGTANLDLRSFRLNLEVHVVTDDAPTLAALTAAWTADVARSQPVDPLRWRLRPWRLRLCEGAARLVSPVL